MTDEAGFSEIVLSSSCIGKGYVIACLTVLISWVGRCRATMSTLANADFSSDDDQDTDFVPQPTTSRRRRSPSPPKPIESSELQTLQDEADAARREAAKHALGALKREGLERDERPVGSGEGDMVQVKRTRRFAGELIE